MLYSLIIFNFNHQKKEPKMKFRFNTTKLDNIQEVSPITSDFQMIKAQIKLAKFRFGNRPDSIDKGLKYIKKLTQALCDYVDANPSSRKLYGATFDSIYN